MADFDLTTSELFEDLSPDDTQRVCAMFQEQEFPGGASLARQGEFSYKFFVVLDGEVDVHRDFEFVGRIGPGDFFGEVGLTTGERRNARVTIHTRCRVAWMMTWDFHQMVEEFPSVGQKIDAAIADRTPD